METLTPKAAWTLLQESSDTSLLDVRSMMEYSYVGHPVGAVHVPIMEPPTWAQDPDFVAKVCEALVNKKKGLVSALPLLIICRSGRRSAQAGALLEQAGFSQVYNILEGFEGDLDENKHRNTVNGWRYHGLSWEQS